MMIGREFVRPARVAALAVLGWLLVVLGPRPASAAVEHCDGAPECCPTELAERLASPQQVRFSVALIGLSNVNERSGTWDADFYLYERWNPSPGFTPQTEIVNESQRIATPFDTTEFSGSVCMRARRIRSTMHSHFNLRTFPFDHQELKLELSDAEYDSHSVVYAPRPDRSGLDDEARSQLSGWKLESDLGYRREARAFAWEDGSPSYDYATFTITVRRHITFHLVKFFLPLFVIVAVAFSVFWIDPEDLNSQVGIGVTCLLAAIAFQFAEANTLPEVEYLTLTDRVYVLCYSAIALAMISSVVANSMQRRGQRERALRFDRRNRVLFPVVLVAAIVAAVARAYAQTGG